MDSISIQFKGRQLALPAEFKQLAARLDRLTGGRGLRFLSQYCEICEHYDALERSLAMERDAVARRIAQKKERGSARVLRAYGMERPFAEEIDGIERLSGRLICCRFAKETELVNLAKEYSLLRGGRRALLVLLNIAPLRWRREERLLGLIDVGSLEKAAESVGEAFRAALFGEAKRTADVGEPLAEQAQL